jgi:hypothetical protein
LDIENNPSPLPDQPENQNPSEPSKQSKFSFSFWSHYFDLEEEDIKDRLKSTLKMGDKSLADVLEKDGDDLYGPFWIATTLVVLLFIGGNLSKIIANKEQNYDYQLLGMACVWVYYFWIIAPIILIALFKIQNVQYASWVRVNPPLYRLISLGVCGLWLLLDLLHPSGDSGNNPSQHHQMACFLGGTSTIRPHPRPEPYKVSPIHLRDTPSLISKQLT